MVGELARVASSASGADDEDFQPCGGSCPGIAEKPCVVAGAGLTAVYVVGVATSWDGVEEAGGVTLIYGQHRAVNFLVEEASGDKASPVVLFLGLDPEFSRAGGWRGEISCS